MPRPALLQAPPRNQDDLEFLGVDVEFDFVDEALDDGQGPHAAAVRQLGLERLRPVEGAADHGLLQLLNVVQGLGQIVSV